MGSFFSTSRYAITSSLRQNYWKAELFIRRFNYLARDSKIFFKLGKNLLWLELHLMSQDETGQLNMQVNLSQNLSAAAEIAAFQPNYEQLMKPQIDEIAIEADLKKDTAIQNGSPKQSDQISIGKKVNPLTADEQVRLNLGDPLKTQPRDNEAGTDLEVQDEEQIKFVES